MTRKELIIWAAGFFDGEGYITIGRRNYKGYSGHYLRVGVNHVAPAPIYKLEEIFGGKIEYDENVRGNRKPRYRWTVSTKKAEEVLKELSPYLVNKIKETELALKFQSTIDSKNTKRIDESTVVFRESIKQELMKENARS